MFVSTFMITAIGAFVTLKIVEPKLGEYDESMAMEDISDEGSMEPLTKNELNGLKWTGVSVLIMFGMLALTIVPENGVLRNPETGDWKDSPFLQGIVTFIFVCFLIPGFVYGRVTGTMKDDRDVIKGMSQAMSTLGLYIVIVFFAAQFVAYFGWSNLGQIFAVKGAQFLQDMGATGPIIFHRLYSRLRLRKPDAWLCLRTVGGHRSDLCSHADADRLHSGSDSGGLPHRRFGNQHHHPDDELLRTDPRLCQQI
jgi:aminobenzoyl-glutamate transport protein